MAAASQQQPQQPPADKPLPPYYQLSLPVYSLATVGPDGGSPTMNLVTYASPISLKPRHYALGLYLNTLSWQNMLATRTGVLQILGEQHAELFELLGRTSGRDVDKLAELAQRGFSVSRRPSDGTPLLDDSLGWMELRFAAEPVNYGDHDVLLVGLTLLGIYEGFKTHYFNSSIKADVPDEASKQLAAERVLFFRTPLDFLFWYCTLTCICALFGLAGIFSAQPTLVTLFFGYNLCQTVLSFNLFVDVLADKGIRYVSEAADVTGYEKGAAALLFINFALSLASGYFTLQAVTEIKQKQRETQYHEMAALSDNLQFEPDMPA
ncbi:flavin reductase [Chlorella sorokiniana]|uniref:Flavin reductase n=1 Tax=Chlorella sorokiniana TaxID=3076 RepID=A0A2P6TX87_CHLSO|nr:flavin reductase [Chlorella sorokiniana]|eukprot:PRW58673.1 flavin reductase [Chlorella sorokiniana]